MQSSKLWSTTAGRKKTFDVIASILTVILLVCMFHSYTSFVFSTNDDLFIKSIVSGEVTGKPEFRCIYLGILSGLMVSRMYLLFPTIPWYGIFLCLCQMLAMVTVLCKCLQYAYKMITKVLIILLFGGISFTIQLQHFALVQYTVVASIVGAAAIFLFFVSNDDEQGWNFIKTNIPSFLLFILSVSIRNKAAYMLLPIAGLLWLFKWLNVPRPLEKKRLVGFFGYMGIILVLIGSIKLLDAVAYAGEDWKEFLAYTRAREQITDYYGYPDYEKYKAIYDQYGISYESYKGASERYQVLLDESINAKSMQALASVVKDEYSEKSTVLDHIRDTIVNFFIRNLVYTDRPLNLFIYASYLAVTLMAIIQKRWKVFWCLGLLITGRMVSWLYLIWQGRYPERVTQGLYFGELLALLGICLYFHLFKPIKKVSILFCIILFGFLTAYFGLRRAVQIRQSVQSRLYYSSAYSELKEYCFTRPQNFYLLDMRSVEYFTEDILHKQEYTGHNFAVLGSWIPKSPLYDDKMEKWGIQDLEYSILNSKNIFFVFRNEKGLEPDYLHDYYINKFSTCCFITEDEFITNKGDSFLVIQLMK